MSEKDIGPMPPPALRSTVDTENMLQTDYEALASDERKTPSDINPHRLAYVSRSKRELRDREPSMAMKDDSEILNDSPSGSTMYIPLKQRQEERQQKLARLRNLHTNQEEEEQDETDDVELQSGVPKDDDQIFTPVIMPQRSLFTEAAELKSSMPQKTEAEIQSQEELKLLEQLERRKLVGAHELAQDVEYKERMVTTWQAPAYLLSQDEHQRQQVRNKYRVLVEGDDIPPLTPRFIDMKFPAPILQYFKRKNIVSPTPIQMQGLPVALSGRDIIGIASTGSGKTIVFALPAILFALEEEMKMPIVSNEGPFALILVPSRELATQIYETCVEITEILSSSSSSWPVLRTLLCIGGTAMSDQSDVLRRGAHLIVATPGRIKQMLLERKVNLDLCKYLAFDEADRLIDIGFEEDIRVILSFFKYQRQTLLFSATMPKKIQHFAKSSLVEPVIVNVGRAGAANLDIVQEIEYVKEEERMMRLLDALQKTRPPVLIFAENKRDVDDIQEYLLLKGIEAVSTHGDKEMEERRYAVNSFKSGTKDVLVATDVASKGLDFPGVQHVINYDMPKDIEDYVHRIGRTGRGGQTGIATTFITKHSPPATLLDLKMLLIEAKQRIPAVLDPLQVPTMSFETTDERGCAYCGGLGHRLADCPKLENVQQRQLGAMKKQGYQGARGGGGEF